MARNADKGDSGWTPPRLSTLLLGTAHTVTQMAQALALAEEEAPGQVIGCMLPRATGGHATLPVPVLGYWDALAAVLDEHQPDRVLVSLPLFMSEPLRKFAGCLDQRRVVWCFLPALADQLSGRIVPPGLPRGEPGEMRHLQNHGGLVIDPLQLIGRRPHRLDETAIAAVLAGRRVLITGAGGSIGSELARIAACYRPARLILMERSENSLFEIDRQIRRLYPDLPRAAILHDVANAPRTLAVIAEERPHVIFHAAAHKHVPMMEDHPHEAVENNFYGTRAIADAAAIHGAERFVMISSDKAVNPSSVMGATKRLAELYIQHLSTRSATRFSMVRFGNVLGSACSVLPIWSQQITAGEAVTVTHPQMTRYFMTIPEAAGLVIQSAAYAGRGARPRAGKNVTTETPEAITSGGEVFLLDMGEPIRILDLARRFIRCQGLEPDVDVPIEFTGIRPGEKLFEELAYAGEDMLPTPHESIRLWRTAPPGAQRMRRIIHIFDHLRMGRPPATHPWQTATCGQIYDALRQAIPEMAAPAKARAMAG